ncbi:tol protein [Ilyonectria robusta]
MDSISTVVSHKVALGTGNDRSGSAMEASFASELVGQEEDRGCTKIMSLYSWADALKQLENPPSKRNSITDRLFGSLREARNKDPPPVANAPLQRRSTSATKQSPVPRIREWLDACNSEHEHHCAASSDTKVDTWHPIWLIDIVERRLVMATPRDRYLALSYVWGSPNRRNPSHPVAQALKSNIGTFQDILPEADIPQTFVDAMWLAKKLGIRYLWIDKLCIVQDDPEEMDKNVKNMAFVFANAYLTIVAAAGDVQTGLTSLNPRKPASRGIRPGGGRDQHELILSSNWNTRGWTLVERLYSRRCLFFFEDSVTWECHCEKWSGSPTSVMKKIRGNRHDCANPVYDAAFAFHHTPWPDLDEYARIVMDYSSRRLTLVDDTLRAFAGITHVLSRSYPGGFIYGMPVMFLDIALLWRPHASIRRRAPSRPPFLPSWSWMGWWFDNIAVDLTLWRAAADYVEDAKPTKRGQESKRYRSPNTFRIRPTVIWNLTDRAATVPVENTGLQFRDLRSRRGSSSSLPPGWSRSGSLYKHDSDDVTLFKYPVPVEEPPKAGAYDPPVGELALPGPLLSFRTTTGFFEVDYLSTLAHRDRPNPPLAVGNIWSKTNRWIGQFRAHDAWLGIQSSNYDGDEKLEFIAISAATERRGSHALEAERFEEFMSADEEVEIVNVLWIERIGEVAYRRGVGHILQKAWDAQAKDEGSALGLLEARHPPRYASFNHEGHYMDSRCLLLAVRSSGFNARKWYG